MSEETNVTEMPEGQFDPNDPKLWDYVPEDIDPEADLVGMKFGPPDDGDYKLVLKLRPETERLQMNPYVKAGNDGFPNLLAVCGVRLRTLDGSNRGFAKDFYLMTKTMKGQPTSSMHFFLKEAGVSVSKGTPLKKVAEGLKEAFEKAGEAGIEVFGRVRWIRPVKLEDGTYEDVKGKKKVSEFNIKEAERIAGDQADWTAERKAEFIENVRQHPWIYYDEDGNEREARVEVAELKPRPARA